METKIKRNSSIELLKIIAIAMIVISHSMPDVPEGDEVLNVGAINLGLATFNLQHNILIFLHNLGQIGNDIFLVCSAWFLLDSHKTKVGKIANMVADCFGASLIMLSIFSALGYRLSGLYFIRQFLPTTFNNNWFVTCYILLYMIHPLLNKVIQSISQSQLLIVDTCFIILYSIISFVMPGGLFYYNELIGFIGIYMIVAYCKLYMPNMMNSVKAGKLILLIGCVGWLLQNVLTLIIGCKIEALSSQMSGWNQFRNPCYILIALGLFILFNKKSFYNGFINDISAMSLLIYVIQCNRILRDYVRFDIYDYIYQNYSYDGLVLWVLIYAVITLVISIIIGKIYLASVGKLVRLLFNKIVDCFIKIYYKLEAYIFKIG
ncbi:hypothetical protein SAMN05660668_02000 [Pseudobutyrivibrio sp. AR14]|uniref:acyltransferase family protein n=1 Tax=Pseudobutyrivibrio sp. AR14 TaxID=1520804 RepID=UPI00088C0F69|nr:acyltransferase family protein [Pseudobutyrivibrio sp. AR14]SCY26979.1 hypothetical protein SAMN05660668_02000 [Pseudobutyrivibrio sp. AR14]